MKTNAILSSLVSLVVGSSSVALADPGAAPEPTAQGRLGATTWGHPGPVVRDHRYDEAPVEAPAVPSTYGRDGHDGDGRWDGDGHRWRAARPVVLASALAFGDRDRLAIRVDSPARFGTLQLTAAGGRTFIRQVVVQLANGQRIVRTLDRALIGNASLAIDLGGRVAIRKITVYGGAQPSGWRRPQGRLSVVAA